jgi:predicted amino acid racemase
LGHLATWCHELPGIELYGIGANLSCLHDIVPDVVNMNLLATYAESIETHLGISLPVISGGSSSALRMLVDGTLPKRINHLRLGEAILLGNIVCYDEPYPSARQDIFTLSAGIIEVKDKPSLPYGQRAPGRVAVGEDPTLSDQGIRRRALVGIGKQDVRSEYLVALDPQITILGDTSDCLVADVTDCDRDYAVGDRVDFRLKYSGLVTAMASVYVTKELV